MPRRPAYALRQTHWDAYLDAIRATRGALTVAAAEAEADHRVREREALARASLAVTPRAPHTCRWWAVAGAPPSRAEAEADPILAARLFHRRLERAREAGVGAHAYTRRERLLLTTCLELWRRRAHGEDARYLLAPGRTGPLPRALARDVRALQAAINARRGEGAPTTAILPHAYALRDDVGWDAVTASRARRKRPGRGRQPARVRLPKP